MSQNQEIIESKLCAYIDGELDAEGRAEIEKHLEANPQHRRLLESLRATRDLIRWLPREPAPAEIAETLNGQLERSVLLNYGGEHLGPSVWPRVFAAAAIVALTAGLGVAVYYALPRSQNPAQLALHAPAVPESGNGDVVPAPPAGDEPRESSKLADADRLSTSPMRPDREAIASKSGPRSESTETEAATPPRPGEAQVDMAKSGRNLAIHENKAGELEQLAREVAQNPAAFIAANESANSNSLTQQNANSLYSANGAASNALVLLVRSDTPARTERQLTTFFNEQQIQWRQAPLSFQAEANLQNGQGAGSVAQAQSVEHNSAGLQRPQQQSAANAPAGGGVGQQLQQQEAAATVQAKASNLAERDALRAGTIPPGAAAAPAATQPEGPALAFRMSGKPDDAAAANDQTSQTAPPAQIQRDAAQFAMANNIRSDGVYVCQMSRRQAAELSNTIGNAVPVKELSAAANNFSAGEAAVAPNGAVSAPAVQPSDSTNAAGGYGGGAAGGPRRQRAMAAPLQSAQDKSAGPPQNSPPPAAPAERSAGIAPAPAGKDQSEAGQGRGAASQLTDLPAGAAAPATQSALASPTTQSVDEPVNVVILVQAAAPTATAGQPAATQPSSPDAATPATSTPSR